MFEYPLEGGEQLGIEYKYHFHIIVKFFLTIKISNSQNALFRHSTHTVGSALCTANHTLLRNTCVI